jgi:hypothetical protein
VIGEHDHDAPERLCRYGARPAFALERASTDEGAFAAFTDLIRLHSGRDRSG